MVLVMRLSQRLCQRAAILRQDWRRQISVTHYLNKGKENKKKTIIIFILQDHRLHYINNNSYYYKDK